MTLPPIPFAIPTLLHAERSPGARLAHTACCVAEVMFPGINELPEEQQSEVICMVAIDIGILLSRKLIEDRDAATDLTCSLYLTPAGQQHLDDWRRVRSASRN